MGHAGWTGRALAAARIDLPPQARGPSAAWVGVATGAALGVSLGADAVLTRAGTALFPSTAGYAHFRFSDYAPLTALGVVGAGAAWPVVCRASSVPRWLYLRVAVVVSVVLLLPDAWLLARGQPAEAVAVLGAMHLAIALITYNLLVRAAPAHVRSDPAAASGAASDPPALWPGRGAWVAMAGLVGLVAAAGLVAVVAVPFDRPDGAVPVAGRVAYLVHGAAGGLLGVAAVALAAAARARGNRLGARAALVGLGGTAAGAAGGLLAIDQAGRLAGMGLMLVGPLVAGFAYLAPLELAPAGGPAGRRPASGGATHETTCARCGATAGRDRHQTPGRARPHEPSPAGAADATGSGADDPGRGVAAADRLADGYCPLCPGRALRRRGTLSVCPCCQSVYRLLPGEDGDETWIATPGRYVTTAVR